MNTLKNNLIANMFLLVWLVVNFIRHNEKLPTGLLILVVLMSVIVSIRQVYKLRKNPEDYKRIIRFNHTLSRKIFLPLYFMGFSIYSYAITKEMGFTVQAAVTLVGVLVFGATWLIMKRDNFGLGKCNLDYIKKRKLIKLRRLNH